MNLVLPVFTYLVFLLLPFFEGCESAVGLFLLHSLTLLTLIFICIKAKQVWLPPLLGFLPFLLYLIVSCFVAHYRYSAVLQLWDWWFIFLMATVFLNLMRNSDGLNLKNVGFYAFILGTAALLVSIVVGWQQGRFRWRGTFANPNDFGTYAVLLLLLGLFHLERVANSWQKRMVWVALAALAVCIAMASSRSIFLGCLAGTVVYLWQRRPSRWIAVSTILFLLLSSSILAYRIFGYSDPFRYYRFKIWKSSLQAVLQEPYLGIGLNMLPWNAARFNFPADVDVGRYARIATSADNQYIQILAETGFLGLLLFLTGWVTLFLLLKKWPRQFLILRYPPLIVLSIVSLFSLALENTAVMSMAAFLLMMPAAVTEDIKLKRIQGGVVARMLMVGTLAALLVFLVAIPFVADREFNAAFHSRSTAESENHLKLAVKLNPYQPYYRFAFVKSAVDSRANLDTNQWLSAIRILDRCIALNRLESEFYLYRARVFRILLFSTRKEVYYPEVLDSYQDARVAAPYNVFQRYESAAFLTAVSQYDRAAQELVEILELEPAFLNAEILLAEVRVRQGNPGEARTLMSDVEQKSARYAQLRTSALEPYVRELLTFDPARKQEVAQLIADASES